ncbi:hypothetical protein [Streptomyces sp. PpalLS-921]|uniref:hypothetical protein n=1 Tax=Streptomyces sp. PpalLS-921 TaxID=1839772 RepID=UPI0015B433B3|nr:hypothetical protein [Streptomyces sp. PpalLS-921]
MTSYGTELVRRARAAGHRTAATYHVTVPAFTSETAWHRLDLRDTESLDRLGLALVIAEQLRPQHVAAWTLLPPCSSRPASAPKGCPTARWTRPQVNAVR